MSHSHKPDFYGLTDPGKSRSINQDQFLIAELSRSLLIHDTSLSVHSRTRLHDRHPAYLFLVADGLAGGTEGARASSLAVESLIHSFLETISWFVRPERHGKDIEKDLRKSFDKCELTIQAEIAENPSLRGMGTTLTMAYLLWPRLYIVHVGDARAYLLRGPDLLQITHDHTMLAPPSPPGSDVCPTSKLLWNVIGGENPEVWPDVYPVDLRPGDVLLFSTDGLTRHVPPERTRAILARSSTSRAACETLVSEANEAGGMDNITVIVVRFGDAPPEAPSRTLAAAAPTEKGDSSAESEPDTWEDLERA